MVIIRLVTRVLLVKTEIIVDVDLEVVVLVLVDPVGCPGRAHCPFALQTAPVLQQYKAPQHVWVSGHEPEPAQHISVSG